MTIRAQGQTPRCADEDVLAVILRMLAPVTVSLFTCSAVAALQEQRGTDPSMDLARFVDGERIAQQLPGLAAVIVRSDGPPRVYVSGERRIGKGDLITPADRMHLGSLTNSITATLIGALAEKQLMTFETRISQTFPELSAKIQPADRDVSVRHLLSHAAGIPTYRTSQSLRWLLTLKGTPTEQRYAFVERVRDCQTPRSLQAERKPAAGRVAGTANRRSAQPSRRQSPHQHSSTHAWSPARIAAEPQPWGHIRTILGTLEVTRANAVYTTPLAIEPAGDRHRCRTSDAFCSCTCVV